MADLHLQQFHRTARPESHNASSSTVLLIGGALLLVLTGLAVTGTFLVFLVFIAPLLLISSPIWVPLCFFLFVTVCGMLSLFGLGLAGLVGAYWLYRFLRDESPPGSGRADRVYETARNMKEYVRDYGGYLQSKLRNVAPGA